MLQTKHYIVWQLQGGFFSEDSEKGIPQRTRPDEIPVNAVSYHYYSVDETMVNGRLLKSEPYDKSATYYLDGEIFTLPDVRRLQMRGDKDYKTLISNMECNNWEKVVQTRFGQFRPIFKDDVVVPLC